MTTTGPAVPRRRRRGRVTAQDRTPPALTAKPWAVFLSRGQDAALLDRAHIEGEEPATIMRAALRLYLHEASRLEAGDA